MVSLGMAAFGVHALWVWVVQIAGPGITGAAESRSVLQVFSAPAISNEKHLPDAGTSRLSRVSELSVTACRGEVEPATFFVRADWPLRGLRIGVSDLRSDEAVMPESAVDIRIVKCWYQAGVRISGTKDRLLVPELLLKDDGLIRVDAKAQRNLLRVHEPDGTVTWVDISSPDGKGMAGIEPRDETTLQPVDIPQGELRQFWLTVRVPGDTQPGEYRGTVRLIGRYGPQAGPGGVGAGLKIRLRVLPFDLAPPVLRYSIYYRGVLTADGTGSISSEAKSPAQYAAEMRNMKAHGVEYPTIYQRLHPELLRRVLQIRKDAGLPTGPLYTLGIGTGSPKEASHLRALQEGVKAWRKVAAEHGYDSVYVYGIDEATGERLKAQRAAWGAVHDAGGKVFVACYRGTFEVMGDLLDLAVFAGPPDPKEAGKYHSAGHEIFSYANPQVGVEEPETYRRNFGLLLWKAGFDGAMDYAYQHSFGHIWNDFDHGHYRDHTFAYPTVDGVIDTLEWEGFREGVDDVRYLSTLLREIEGAGDRTLAGKAKAWVANLDPAGDLDRIRAEIIGWILRFR